MTYQYLINAMLSWGFEIKKEHFNGFTKYVSQMLDKERVVIVSDNKITQLILFYYLTDDYRKVYKKSTWEMAKDNPEGHQIYIDKMICRHWTKQLRNAVKTAIQDRYPMIKEAYYHQAPFDRCVKINRSDGVLCPQI